MAGLDQPSNGEARLSPEYSVGILLQEPPLNEEKTVLGNVEEGVGEIKAKLDRFNEISALMAEPDADFDALMEKWVSCRKLSTPQTPGTWTPSWSRQWKRCAARPLT